MARTTPRMALARSVFSAIGEDVLSAVEIGTGWPSIADVACSAGWQPVALHIAQVSPFARQSYEWRFQNPLVSQGSLTSPVPVTAPSGTLPILVGSKMVDGRMVLVCADGRSRVGSAGRVSILFHEEVFRDAAVTGWAEYTSNTGETTTGLRPRLFPLYVELLLAGVRVSPSLLAGVAAASGLVADENPETAERARRVAMTYVRDARFSRVVREAYENRCAMCGLGLGLVAGAHIYPVGAPGSRDTVWNGIALCHNHHSAFDAHRIWIGRDFRLAISPELTERAARDRRDERFVRHTNPALRVPALRADRPDPAMLEARYRYYDARYGWAPAF